MCPFARVPVDRPCARVPVCPEGREESSLPVVPHKAVAEVSKIGNYRRGELLCMGGKANPVDRKVVGVVFLGVGALVT